MDGVTNGLGPEIERVEHLTADGHRLRQNGWINRIISHGLRNHDRISADRFAFGHASTVELECNTRETGCPRCIIDGVECLNLGHTSNDPTYTDVVWTPAVYATTDHVKGVDCK